MTTSRPYITTGVKRGELTPLYTEWMARTLSVLTVMVKLQKADMPSPTALRARVAALSRWNKAKRAGGAAVEPAHSEVARLLPAAGEARTWRRGESAYFVGSHRDYALSELVYWCKAIAEHRIKMTELINLYAGGRIRVPAGTVGRLTSGKSKDGWRKYEGGDGFTALGAPPRVRVRPCARVPPPPTSHTHRSPFGVHLRC